VGAKDFADNVGITAKSPLPETVAEHDETGAIWATFFGGELAAENGIDAEERKEVWRDEANGDLLRLLVAFGVAEINGGAAAAGSRGKIGKLGGSLLVVAEIRRGDSGEGLAAGAVVIPDGNETLGILIGKRLHEDGVDHGEDGGVGADAESQGESGDQREAWAFAEQAKSVTNILQKQMHPEPPGPTVQLKHSDARTKRRFQTPELQTRAEWDATGRRV